MWTLLITALPSRPSAVRLRIWRALKALGCAALRDGAYLLPQSPSPALEALAGEVRTHGGTASVLSLDPRDAGQRDEWRALFDRSEAYAEWRASAQALRSGLAQLDETAARRQLRAVVDALAAIQRVDHVPGPASAQADTDLDTLRRAVEARFSPGEPAPRADARIARLDARKFQGRRWATRARPQVDRLACAWLIRRFIDRQARFVWLDEPLRLPRGAIGFDFDGARFTHVGARVSFEVLVASFGLDGDVPLQRIAAIVRCLDAGGIPVPEAAGVDAVLGGLRALHADDDDRLLGAACSLFDALHAAPGAAA